MKLKATWTKNDEPDGKKGFIIALETDDERVGIEWKPNRKKGYLDDPN